MERVELTLMHIQSFEPEKKKLVTLSRAKSSIFKADGLTHDSIASQSPIRIVHRSHELALVCSKERESLQVHRDPSDELKFRFELSHSQIRVEFTFRVGVGRGHPDSAAPKDGKKDGRKEEKGQLDGSFSFLRVLPPSTTKRDPRLTLEAWVGSFASS